MLLHDITMLEECYALFDMIAKINLIVLALRYDRVESWS